MARATGLPEGAAIRVQRAKIIVLPAFGGETIKPRWPIPIGATRSTTRIDRSSSAISKLSLPSGWRGRRLSKATLCFARANDPALGQAQDEELRRYISLLRETAGGLFTLVSEKPEGILRHTDETGLAKLIDKADTVLRF